MIISASRRTDIPNYFSEWFFNRINEGYVLVRNPLNIHQVSKINLNPDVVDCIVFWTKNPTPMLKQLGQLVNYQYYFQFTLNSYGQDIEPNIPSKNNEIIQTFQRLADEIGADKVIWRYDPIFINNKYTLDYHRRYFEKIAAKLKGYTKKCTISFIDYYRNTQNNIKGLAIQELTNELKREIAGYLSTIASAYNLKIDTCAEAIELEDINISHARCIDDRLIEKITGFKLNIEKDKSQRLECGCVASIDIGMYNTCKNGCKYCYANYSGKNVANHYKLYDPNSPLLCGELSGDDLVKEREVKSLKVSQTSFL